MTDEPLVLGIETSCDETGVGIVRGTTLLATTSASRVVPRTTPTPVSSHDVSIPSTSGSLTPPA